MGQMTPGALAAINANRARAYKEQLDAVTALLDLVGVAPDEDDVARRVALALAELKESRRRIRDLEFEAAAP